MSQLELMLQDVGRGDEGFYMCVAGNTLGETTSLATLEIAGAAAGTSSRATVMSPCCRGGQAGGTLAGDIVTFNNFVFHCLPEVVVN